jgi:extracellular factor (EF) 3-hydroxypalmitic acid methyl ester biosynthesis protein
MDSLRPTESLLTFRNSQDIPSRGTIMHLSRNLVVFEVYNPYSIVQLSEVLKDLKIRRGERTIYDGRAVVSNLVNTGLMLIVSATMVDPWSDLEHLAPGTGLREEVAGFVDDWDRSNRTIQPPYRTLVSTIRNFLEELSQWLAHGEVVAGIADRAPAGDDVKAFVGDVEGGVLPKIAELFGDFERIASQIPEDVVTSHKMFARREIHPLVLCSPFIHRTFTKPLGYAGDYEMVNMMLRDSWEGGNTYAKIINSIIIKSDGARAHRNRIDRLIQYLEQEARRVQPKGRALRILNIACGPAAEIQRFIRTSPLSERCQITLLDFNAETLEYTRGCIKDAVRASGHLPSVEFVHKSIHDLLQEARGRKDSGPGIGSYDLVYCAGLFDYLSDKICARLLDLFFKWTERGGLLVSTNVHPRCPVRFFIEHLLEWNLIYRDDEQMLSLQPPGSRSVVTEEPTRVNIFLESRKPDNPADQA